MATYIRPFRKEDLAAFTPIEPLSTAQIKDKKLAQAMEDSGLAVTGIRNGSIVGCGGVHPIDDFRGQIWLRLNKDCLNYRIEIIRWIKSGLKIIEETFPFKQLDLAVDSCFVSGIKLVEFLGFKMTQTKDNWLIYSKRVQK